MCPVVLYILLDKDGLFIGYVDSGGNYVFETTDYSSYLKSLPSKNTSLDYYMN